MSPRAVGMRHRPSHARSNTTPSGMTGGTLGGAPRRAAGRRPGTPQMAVGDEFYLWLLIVIEVLVMGLLRKKFRAHHGG